MRDIYQMNMDNNQFLDLVNNIIKRVSERLISVKKIDNAAIQFDISTNGKFFSSLEYQANPLTAWLIKKDRVDN